MKQRITGRTRTTRLTATEEEMVRHLRTLPEDQQRTLRYRIIVEAFQHHARHGKGGAS
jgi:hypothetical protein